MKVLIVTSPITEGTGVDNYWERLDPRIISRDIEIIRLTGVPSRDGVRFPRFKLASPRLPADLLHLVRTVREIDPDVVVTSISQSDIMYSFVMNVLRKPWIIAVHGQPYPVQGQASSLKTRLWTHLWRRASLRCTSFICVSNDTKKFVPPGAKSTIVYSPISLPELKENNTGKILRVGFIGRLSHEKDPALFGQISELFPDLEFHAYGEGSMEQSLKASHPATTWHGYVNARRALDSLDLLLITSISEGLPLVSIEASAAGVPVLATDVGGIAEAIHPELRNLLLVPASQRTDLAVWQSKIEALRDPDVRQRVISLQRSWVGQTFDLGRSAHSFADALQDSIARFPTAGNVQS